MSQGFEPLDVAVVGGGISGLACAFWAKQRGHSVALFETSPIAGGIIRSVRTQGYIADGGPQSLLTSEALSQLVHDSGIDGLLMPVAPQAQRAYVFHRGKLAPVPQSPQQLAGSSLLSLPAKLRLLGEPFIARSSDVDESVAAFVRRRTGGEVLQTLVAPFVSGTFAGDATKLSMRSAFPLIAEFEQEHGSVLRGALARGKATRPRSGRIHSADHNGPMRRRSVGFRGGNDVLPRALAAHLGADFHSHSAVQAIWQRGQWMELLVAGEPDTRVVAKTIVLATPAQVAADLLEPLEPRAAAQLRAIDYPAVVQIAMAYPREAIGAPLDGFGFLASRREGLRILGCVWNSVMFPDRCPPDELLCTSFLGGATDRSAANLGDDELARAAHQDLQRVLKIKDRAPHIVAGFRWQEAIPQYNIGHGDRLRVIEECLARLPQVRLCGNYLRGPSVPDCIALAKDVVTNL